MPRHALAWPALLCFWPALPALLRACFSCTGAVVAGLSDGFLPSPGLLLACFCFALVCLLLAYFLCTGAAFAPGLLLACSWPALSALRLASVWPFCYTGAVVSARRACSVWPAAGPLCLAYVVWVWPAVPGPWPENRAFLLEPRAECQLPPTKVQLPGLFLDNYPRNLQRI